MCSLLRQSSINSSMNLISHILSRSAVLSVHFTAPDTYVLILYRLRQTVDSVVVERKEEVSLDRLESLKVNEPMLLLFSGHGVACRVLPAPEIVSRVKADADTFAWTEDVSEKRFVFARREQVKPLFERLDEVGIVPVWTEYAAGDDQERVVAVAVHFYSEQVRLRYLCRPSDESSQLLSLICRRVRLPLLGAVLALLVVNTMVYDSLKKRHAVQRTLLAAREKEHGVLQARSAEREAVAEEFLHHLPWRYAVLMDRVGSQVPEKTVLREFCIQPLDKRIETDNPMSYKSNTILIRGATKTSSDISVFVGRLRNEPFVHELKLSSIEQERDSGLWSFEISLQL